jgi:type IV secretory pathway VirB3-like protein
MKAKLSIILFLVSLVLMATDNIIQGLISVILLAIAVNLMNRDPEEVEKTIERFETKVTKLFKPD